ncbi:MAG: helix-turn-helix domain-containing protein [Treponema sp.]|nr:helix-turn-helix domain-containing protein [Treponema sp.]
MNAEKTGKLILEMRTQTGLTQKALAEMIHVSDKAVCKWETGHGCPDITVLNELSKALGVDIPSILSGELPGKKFCGGNLRRLTFFRCAGCGNLIVSTSAVELNCCGKRLEGIELRKKGKLFRILEASVLETDGEFYVTMDHAMEKSDFIAAVFAVYYDRIITIPLYPEQAPSFTIWQIAGCSLYALDNHDELYTIKISEVVK